MTAREPDTAGGGAGGERPPEAGYGAGRPPCAVIIEKLSLAVGGFRLDGVDLEIAPREYVVLMGPTGAGKSLLLKCLCGLIRPDAGRVWIGGVDVTAREPRRRRIGYVAQEGALFPHLNVERNLTFGLRVAGLRHGRAMAEIAPLIDDIGLRPLLHRRPGTLSGGERQKVALARALAARPRLLVLDEPVSALDERTRREVCALLKRVQRSLGVATLHVCHNTAEARDLGDRAGVFVAGRLAQIGPLEELLRNPATESVARLLDATA
jgi:ABC-type sugar transport system ATPase subunit